MKRILPTLAAILVFQTAMAQITITATDMPVAGDTLRYSFAALPDSTISPADSGANRTWNYALSPARQAVDTYQLAASVNILYALIGLSAAGYKVADSFPIPGGIVSIQQVYTFFQEKTGPSRYETKAFAAVISGIPTPINYTTPDVWYFFPLNYMNSDSAQYKLNITLPAIGGIKENGYRKSRDDGWGTITTPYYTTPVNCIRVRSEIHEIDSLSFGPLPAIGFPRNTVEYKWLVNGDHYPALWVTSAVLPGGGGETITSVKYRDVWRDTTTVNQVANVSAQTIQVTATPNPAADGITALNIPAAWQHFTVEVYDMGSKQVAKFDDQRNINISSLPAGNYIGRILSGVNTAYVKIVR